MNKTIKQIQLEELKKKAERFRAYIRDKGVTPYAIKRFRKLILDHYANHGRKLPWRETTDPYKILVSEIMLQQTQVPRVEQKYPEFLKAFPDAGTLAKAASKKLLKVWQGMGYNRRALLLQKTARIIIEEYQGSFPRTTQELVKLPGIGPATAADIMAFAFNKPTVVIETNIRSVFIQMFFPDRESVEDKEMLPLIERTLDRKNPCDWYNGLMDFGTALKQIYPNPSRKSRHYVRQSPFEGSNRQVRSRILKLLLKSSGMSVKSIREKLDIEPDKIQYNVKKMTQEGMIKEKGSKYYV